MSPRARLGVAAALLVAAAAGLLLARRTAGPPPPEPIQITFPASTFRTGCDPERLACAPGDPPPREVKLGPFAFDRDEVTAADYLACMDAGACPDARKESPTCSLGQPGRERRPMNCTTAAHARAYCAWRGARLPTEDEWERAARGVDGRIHPWGDAPADCTRAVFRDPALGCVADGPAEVGSKPAGATPEGAQDLAGNVWEWVTTPDGAEAGRGGAFDLPATELRTFVRIGVAAGTRSNNAGFRCARSVE